MSGLRWMLLQAACIDLWLGQQGQSAWAAACFRVERGTLDLVLRVLDCWVSASSSCWLSS